MADDRDESKVRDLRRLAKRFNINIQSPPNRQQWPAAHQRTFQSITKIGDQKFDSFCASIDIRSSNEPWREQTKHRAEWLAKRAARLFNQQRNESGWRFSLENEVLRRFSVEVACPKCRARIWRSEIEACINEPDDAGANLEDRRKNRKPCTCAPNDRPQDYYEIGTNPLFDDRTQEVVIHDPLLRSQLPKQEPDRIYGLQETNNFQKLLSTLVPGGLAYDDIALRELVRSCPFKDEVEPLLFPFLILEAKSGKSSSGFYEIQTQTAFPIFALLKLQKDLLARAHDGGAADGPLIWFFANRGDAWRVYGCCISDNEPTRYDIIQLWDGSIMSEDSSLQLLLIVDYIFDWARDIYRPSILRQLKSIVTGSTFDQISLAEDSDIYSTRRNVSNWVQAAPSTVAGFEFEQDWIEHDVTPALDHQSLLPIPIPNTKLGTLRSADLVESRVEALFITEQNVIELLPLGSRGEEPARQMITFLAKWNELLLLTGDELDDIEEAWTGKSRSTTEFAPSSSSSEFYVLIETNTFMSTSWTITRDLTYLAVSKPALDIIFSNAEYKREWPGRQIIANAARSCSKTALIQTLQCLLSGSPSQLFIAATTSVCLSLYALPERKGSDHAPPVETLAFGRLRRQRLAVFIHKFHRICDREKIRNIFHDLSLTQLLAWNRSRKSYERKPVLEDLSFIRKSETIRRVFEKDMHDKSRCAKCIVGSKYNEKPHYFTIPPPNVFSAYGLNLVISLNLSDDSSDKHDICLFAVGDVPQGGYGHHTIRHPVLGRDAYLLKEDTLWNFPLPYRPITIKEGIDAKNWVCELNRLPIVKSTKIRSSEFRWDGLQMLLHYLSRGKPWDKAVQEIKLKDRSQSTNVRIVVYKQSDQEDKQRRKQAGQIVKSQLTLGWKPYLEYTCGDFSN